MGGQSSPKRVILSLVANRAVAVLIHDPDGSVWLWTRAAFLRVAIDQTTRRFCGSRHPEGEWRLRNTRYRI